jgi:hypothetical protein
MQFALSTTNLRSNELLSFTQMSAHSTALKRIKSASKRVNNKKRQNSVGNNQDMEELGSQTDRQQAVPGNSQAPAYMIS